MIGLFKRRLPPKLVEAWGPLCERASDCFTYVSDKIRESEHGDALLEDIDRARLLSVICHGALTGLFMAMTRDPAEGRKYIEPFSVYLAEFVAKHMPELGSEKSKIAKEFTNASTNTLPDIIAKTGAWRNNSDGPFVFEQAIAAYVIRDSARAKYTEELPGVGSYMPPLPVRMYKIWSEMMAYGNSLATSVE